VKTIFNAPEEFVHESLVSLCEVFLHTTNQMFIAFATKLRFSSYTCEHMNDDMKSTSTGRRLVRVDR
jgi:hypothetical protein